MDTDLNLTCNCHKSALPPEKGTAPINDPDLFSQISHEIRTPLNAIIGMADLLSKSPSREEQEEYIRTLKVTSDDLLELINNIMDYSKLQSGVLHKTEKEIDLRELVDRSLTGLKNTAQAKNLKLFLDFDKNLPQLVIGDPVKIGQVLINLVSNAIKFTETGSVKISVTSVLTTASEVVIAFSVKDTGIGVPKQHLKNIFLAFNQGDDDINIKYAGTGLGLSISQKLIKMLGGNMRLKSSPGEGSDFTFKLSMKPVVPENVTEPAVKKPANKGSAKDIKILVVEDNSINILVMEKYLSTWDAQFKTVRNGREALKAIKTQDFDIVLMDLLMPIMNGVEAACAIRELEEEHKNTVPIIALTASSRNFLEPGMEKAKFDDYVNKPFNPQELLHKILFYSGKGRQDQVPVFP